MAACGSAPGCSARRSSPPSPTSTRQRRHEHRRRCRVRLSAALGAGRRDPDGRTGAVPVGQGRLADRPVAARAGRPTGTGRAPRLAYWLQAELVAVATDLAEIVGGAVALNLLFDLPLVVGAVITTAVSTALLVPAGPAQPADVRAGDHRHARPSSRSASWPGCSSSRPIRPPPWPGWCRASHGTDSALLAVGMLGATVMPHAVYLHSALVRDRHGAADAGLCAGRLLKAIRLDVTLAMMRRRQRQHRHAAARGQHPVRPADRRRLQAAHAAIGDRAGSGRRVPVRPRACWPPGSPRPRSAATPAR